MRSLWQKLRMHEVNEWGGGVSEIGMRYIDRVLDANDRIKYPSM